MFNRRKGERRAPTTEPVPDGEVIEVMDAIAKNWAARIYTSETARNFFVDGFTRALIALRDHFHVTITRKEGV